MSIGVPYDTFWNITPKDVEVFGEVYKAKWKDDNYKLWLNGCYMVSALNASVGNMFKKKGAQPIEYEKEPIDIFAEKRLVITDDMTEEEKIEQTKKLFGILEDLENKFNSGR